MEEIKNNIMNIFSLGKIKHGSNVTYIHINNSYIKATKQLEHFSHIIVFWWYESKNRKNLTSCIKSENIESGIFASRDLDRPNPICSSITEILNVDNKTGIIKIKKIDALNNADVIDIKAYFPIEDRIKIVTFPDYIKNITENYFENNKNITNLNDKSIYNITQIGEVKKVKNKIYIQIYNEFKKGLKGLDNFSHIKILWWFDKFDDERFRSLTLCNPPYENSPRTGIFASRSPVRPNPIGLSNAKIIKFDYSEGILEVTGIDAFDKTPVIDIKPYIPFYDRINTFKLPPWVSHWNQWKPEQDQYVTSDSINLIESDFDKLSLFKDYEVANKISNKKIIQDDVNLKENDLNYISIKGAKEHNLKNINVKIPHNKLTVVTGVSGSGKSSLVFDTIFAEAERRFFESLSSTARQLVEQLQKPEVEEISGLLPAIAIEQKTINRNPRSTVGTITEIYDLLRLLFARLGERYCPQCNRKIKPLTSNQMIENLLKLKGGINFSINDKKNNKTNDFESQSKDDKKVYDDLKKRLTQVIGDTLNSNNGRLYIILDKNEYILTTHLECSHCSITFFPLISSIFSYNNSEGLCQECSGLGVKLEVDSDLVISRPKLSLLDGASPLWWGNLRNKKLSANWMVGELFGLAEEMNIDLELPWEKLPEDFRNKALYGTGDKKIKFKYTMGKSGRSGEIERPVSGAINHINRLFNNSSASTVKNRFMQIFMKQKTCTSCNGEKLCVEARYVKLGDKRFPEIANMTISQCYKWINNLSKQINNEQQKIYNEFFSELNRRLRSLINVGLDYLTLDRSCPSLSGGEGQRIRLATQINNGLTGLLYVLDEPSIGLHSKDTKELIKTLTGLRERGNTILVVEHDAEIMKNADHLIELGPLAGTSGGELIASGNQGDFINNKKSLTAGYLDNRLKVNISNKQKRIPDKFIKIKNARLNNLKNLDVNFPIGLLTCITGVSGSGKSSLITKTLAPLLANCINNSNYYTGVHDSIEGIEYIDRVIIIDQSSIGRTPRSNPCTYVDLFDKIRKIFACTTQAKSNKIEINNFSFNNKSGQCPVCQGLGEKKIEMHFLPDVYVQCPECKGMRFNYKVLNVKYRDKNIAQVLNMDINEAYNFFIDQPYILKILKTIIDVGLGYIKLGQSALTFSGGEAQRIKLAKELSKTDTGNTIYILDEPTTGLHFADIQKLLDVLYRLVTAGNTVIIIEHNPDIIKNADWIIDLGPLGGENGGYIIATGTPEEVAKVSNSHTGNFLKELI